MKSLREKYNTLSLGVAVALTLSIAGCSSEDGAIDPSCGAITFELCDFKDMVSRGSIISDFESGDSFAAFAYCDDGPGSESETIMDNQEVTKGDDDSWSYSPVKYWSEDTYHDFYSYAPYDAGINVVSNNAKPQLTYTPSTVVSEQVDLLFAEPLLDLTPQADRISFNFNHALAAIRFEAKVLDESITGEIYKIELKGITASATADVDGATTEWTPDNTTADYSAALNFDDGESYRKITTTTATTDLTPDDNVLLLLPQTLPSTALIEVTLTVNGVDDKLRVSFSFPQNIRWVANTKITYVINIGTSVTISYVEQEWDDIETSEDTVGTLTLKGAVTLTDEDWDGDSETDQNVGDLDLDSGNIEPDSENNWEDKDDVDSEMGGETDFDNPTPDDDGWEDNTTDNNDSIGGTDIDGGTIETPNEDWDGNVNVEETIGD